MNKLTVYTVYMDDGTNTFKETIPAESKSAAKKFVEGNGEVIAVKISDLQDIDLEYLDRTLRNDGWGADERAVILRTLEVCGLERIKF